MDLAGTQGTAFEVSELVEDEQSMIASAFKVTVPDAVLLLTMAGAHTRIHLQHNASRRTAAMNPANPLAGEISQGG
jgi:hypothetical protein